MASVDTFFEGQERSETSANPHLLRRLRGMIDEYQGLRVLNFEMEAGTLFKMGAVYGFAAGCVVGIIAQRGQAEEPLHDVTASAVDGAIRVAVEAADRWSRGDERRSGPAEHPVDGDLDRHPVGSLAGLAVAGGVAGDGPGDPVGVGDQPGGPFQRQPPSHRRPATRRPVRRDRRCGP